MTIRLLATACISVTIPRRRTSAIFLGNCNIFKQTFKDALFRGKWWPYTQMGSIVIPSYFTKFKGVTFCSGSCTITWTMHLRSAWVPRMNLLSAFLVSSVNFNVFFYFLLFSAIHKPTSLAVRSRLIKVFFSDAKHRAMTFMSYACLLCPLVVLVQRALKLD